MQNENKSPFLLQEISRQAVLEDIGGKQLPAKTVFSLAIRFDLR